MIDQLIQRCLMRIITRTTMNYSGDYEMNKSKSLKELGIDSLDMYSVSDYIERVFHLDVFNTAKVSWTVDELFQLIKSKEYHCSQIELERFLNERF